MSIEHTSSPTSTVRFEQNESSEITDPVLVSAANLFSKNYGVWGPKAEQEMGSFAKNGRRVRISPAKLREQCVPSTSRTTYIRAIIGEDVAGHVFASRWLSGTRNVCWITQLVVKIGFRNQRIATQLLTKLREGEDDHRIGVLSSHPATIRATLTAFGGGLENVDLSMAREYARDIMSTAPVPYVQSAILQGSDNGSICSANTKFFVDHREPEEALAKIQEQGKIWPFGALLDGHEFLVLVERKAEKDQDE